MAPPAPQRAWSLPSAAFSPYFSKLKTSTYADNPRVLPGRGIRTMSWNNSGSQIATGAQDSTLRVWNPERPNVKNSTELKGHQEELKGRKDGITRVAFNPANEFELASCCALDKSVRLWDVRTKASVGEVKVGNEPFTLAWTPNGQELMVGRKVNETFVKDTAQALKEEVGWGKEDIPILVEIFTEIIDSDGNWEIESTFKDDYLVPVSRATLSFMSQHRQTVQTNQTTFDWAGKHLLTTTGDGSVKIMKYPSMEVIHELNAHTSACYCLAMSPSGKHLALGGGDALISLWDTEEWICVRTLDEIAGTVRSVEFSFDGSYVVGGSDEGNRLSVAHVETGEYVHHIDTIQPAPVVQWHPSRYALAYSADSQLKIVGGMTT